MKKLFLLCLSLIATLGAFADVRICDVSCDANGHFNTSFIKSGSITWNKESHTLTLDNAVVEYNTDNVYDNIRPIRISEAEATIVINGHCKLTTNGFVVMAFDSYNDKKVTIQGDGSLQISSTWIDIFLIDTDLTIKEITLESQNGIANNGNGVNVALAFNNVQADIKGGVDRIGEGISFTNCSITYPADAYIDHSDYGYYIAYGNGNAADHIIISRNAEMIKGDVNNDGEVNIADINAVIDVILGGGNNASADVNKDGEINIADVNTIINIILGGGAPTPSETETISVNGVAFKMVKVEGGTFTMGATPEQGSDAGENEYPAHQVTLSSFSIGETEVTQALWQAVMGNNPSFFKNDDELPVEWVSWEDCQEFITKLNQMTGKQFRLPTEAEWEYAARGGNKSKGYKYSGSNDVNEVAWYWMNCGSITHPVGTKKANELGLYDMSGNVFEWCNDFMSYYTEEAQANPTGPTTGIVRVFRGGGWGNSDPASCRVSYRDSDYPGYSSSSRGLRLAM